MKNYTYNNDKIAITFDEKKCCHAAHCFRELPDVFDGAINPPIRPDGASVDEIIRVIEMCPSSALTYSRLSNESPNETPQKTNTAITPNRGPLLLRGELNLKNEASMTRLTLCRCGESRNKPYCDGSHRKTSFNAPVQETFDTNTSFDATGPVKLTPITNGPIAFSGKLHFTSRDNKTQYCREKGALCRCGASNIKPFCDGNHRNIQFKTE